MFDTHCHLNNQDLFENIRDVISFARESGVKKILVPGYDIPSSYKAIEIAESYEDVYCSIGISPTTEVESSDIEKCIFKIEEMFNQSKKIVAVGEIGLDYYHLQRNEKVLSKEDQKTLFFRQLNLSKRYGLPAIIHNRQSTEDLINVLKIFKPSNFSLVFHCCEANQKIYDYALKNKVMIGLDGDLTYDENKKIFFKNIPLDLMLLETDSPYLTPEPLRSIKSYPNKPENLKYIVEVLSQIMNISTPDTVRITYENSLKFFNV